MYGRKSYKLDVCLEISMRRDYESYSGSGNCHDI